MVTLPMTRKHGSITRPDTRFRRLGFLGLIFLLGFGAVVVRLVSLQIMSHDFYTALASDQHGIFAELFPERGTVYLKDPRSTDGIFPVAINKNLNLVYAAPRDIENPHETAEKISSILQLDPIETENKLSLVGDPYEPLKHRVSDEIRDQLLTLNLPGIGFVSEPYRFYPEAGYLSHVIGFVGSNEKGERVGRYGIEGYWNKELAGSMGYLRAESDRFGSLIGAADSNLVSAKDGSDIVLTIDRTIQYVACDKLKQAIAKHQATGGALIIMNPKTGAIVAMCGFPTFDPNDFSKVDDPALFNNPAIFNAYEPGSVFKAITLAAAIDAGKIAPNTSYEDTGQVKIGPFTIRNSDGAANGWQTMTQVLEKSLNTGSIFAVRALGDESFAHYVSDFGFGEKSGVELDTESLGDVSSLSKSGDIWSATGSFGQGISVTPLQMVTAFTALVNGGRLMRPYVIDQVIDSDSGVGQVTKPKLVRQVITEHTSSLISGMLAQVVEDGHGKRAAVPGFWVGGKTGTAQIARADGGGYEKDASIGSFIGFAPVDDPKFVMLVKIDRPKDVLWAESSAAPLFGEIAKFLLNYMQIPPNRVE